MLDHFAGEALFTSPLAARLDPECGGLVSGKAAIRAYWQAALDRNPSLHFEITSIHAGVDCILIGFRNERGQDRVEALRFRDGLVFEGHGTFRPSELGA